MGMHTRTLCLYIERHLERNEIEEVLNELNFNKIGNEGQFYKWYDSKYSIFGCSFTFRHNQKVSIIDNHQETEKFYKTVCEAITHKPNAPRDRKVQNEVLKSLQKKYGGLVYQPEYEKSGFFGENTNLSLTEEECTMAYLHFKENLDRGKTLIANVDEKSLSNQYEYISTHDRSLLINNILLPFFVSSLETFIKSFFMRYLNTNQDSICKKGWHKNKYKKDHVGTENIEGILNGKKNIPGVLSGRIKWQDLGKVAHAYKLWLGFDLKTEVLEKEFKFEDNAYKIGAVLGNLIKTRHYLIHEAKLDLTLGKENVEKIWFALQCYGDFFIQGFMNKYNLRIDGNSLYNS